MYALQQKANKVSPRPLCHHDYINQFSTDTVHISSSTSLEAETLSRDETIILLPGIYNKLAAQEANEKIKKYLKILPTGLKHVPEHTPLANEPKYANTRVQISVPDHCFQYININIVGSLPPP